MLFLLPWGPRDVRLTSGRKEVIVERILAPGDLGSSHQFVASFCWTLISQMCRAWSRKSPTHPLSSAVSKFMLFSRWQMFYETIYFPTSGPLETFEFVLFKESLSDPCSTSPQGNSWVSLISYLNNLTLSSSIVFLNPRQSCRPWSSC